GRFARGGPAAVIRRPTDGHRRAAAGIPRPAPPGERERAVLRPPRAARGPHAGGGGAARRDAGEAGRSRAAGRAREHAIPRWVARTAEARADAQRRTYAQP